MFRCANCIAPLQLDTGTIATCHYCGAQTRVDDPSAIAKPPLVSGSRLADAIRFVKDARSIVLLDANKPVPIFHTALLSTSTDNQEKLEVNLVQGNDPITSFAFPIHQRAPRGVPKISLTVRVSTNGEMSLTLLEPGTTNALDRDALRVRVVD